MSTPRIAMLARLCAAGAAVIVLGSAARAAADPAQRPYSIDDMFELESIGRYYGGPYSFSPGGRGLAFTRVRASKTLTNHQQAQYLWGHAGGDIWLQRAAGEAAVDLTRGSTDGAGWWAPQWSPDGKYLAMLSTRGGNVTLWVWNEASGELRQLTRRGVDLVDVRARPFLWVDERHVLCPVLPEGEQPDSLRVGLQTQQIATAAWPKAIRGEEPTASVLTSGATRDLAASPQGELLLINVAAGTSRTLAPSSTKRWQLAPNGRAVAYARQVSVYTPKPNEVLRHRSQATYTVEIRRVDGELVRTDRPVPRDVLVESLRWSPDGGRLAFLAFGATRERPPSLYRVDAHNGRVHEIDLGDLDAEPVARMLPQLEWTADGAILLLAARREQGQGANPTARRDWWLVARDSRPRNVTREMHAPPKELWPQAGRTAFVGLSDSEVWRIEPRGAAENLTLNMQAPVAEIVWPAVTEIGADEYPLTGRTYSQIVLAVRTDRTQEYSVLDLRTLQLRALKKPAPQAELVAFSPESESAVYAASDREGTFIWRAARDASAPVDELMAANTFLRTVAQGEFKLIEYTSLKGEKLRGWLLLPPDYQPGRRYPMITWVYAGSMAGPAPSSFDTIAEPDPLSMHIPSAAGYVVLTPSMPLGPLGQADDPMARLPDGVLPVVDEAVRLGIADPQRVYLMGHSFGGYSTYGLITQTNRFAAAVSLAGLSNFISFYGTLDARRRYSDHAHEYLFQMSVLESSQSRMGNPPWKDLDRYIRNSPIFFVDRVRTPLMIIQGDMDYVALQQGEEFFVSLYRQGKPAQFVRYWGEGHIPYSPANVRDMWRRIFAWLERFKSEREDPPAADAAAETRSAASADPAAGPRSRSAASPRHRSP